MSYRNMGATMSCLASCCSRNSPTNARFHQEPLTDVAVQSPGIAKRIQRPPPLNTKDDSRDMLHRFIVSVQNSPRKMKRFAELMAKSPRRAVQFIRHFRDPQPRSGIILKYDPLPLDPGVFQKTSAKWQSKSGR